MSAPTFIDGIGPPLEQLEEDYRDEQEFAGGGHADAVADVLCLIAEVKRLRAAAASSLVTPGEEE